MFDIERELKDIKFQNHMPGEAVRQKILHMANEKMCKGPRPEKVRLKPWVALPLAAALAAVMMLFVLIPTAQAAGYYTIDINPSISVEVDKNDNVLLVLSENEDAALMLAGSDFKGMPFKDAFGAIVKLAANQGYLQDESNVLVAHFGDAPGISVSQAKAAVEEVTEAQVSILLLQSEKSDYVSAKKQNRKAGIELLNKEADEMHITAQDTNAKIDALYEKTEKGEDKGKSAGKANAGRANAAGNSNADSKGGGSSNGIGNSKAGQDKKGSSSKAKDKEKKIPPKALDNRNENAQKDKPNRGRQTNPNKPVR